MVEGEVGYVDRVFPGQLLWDYRMAHPRTKSMGKFAKVLNQLVGVYNCVWCRNRFRVGRFHNVFFDYKMALRLNSTTDDSDSDESEDTTFDDVENLYPTLADLIVHPIGPNMADGSETSSDEPDSDSDSDSSSGAGLYPSDEVFYQFHSRDTVHTRDAPDRWTS